MKNELVKFFTELLHIRDGIELEEKIAENIEKNIEFRGANFWLLIFAIFIASIGLNINSTAIIIGAMLISPLMGPIVGIGLSLGINDSNLLKRSAKHLLIATAIGVVISALYFFLSPISNIQSELLSRTNPTIYDVLIALFGGFAGIVGTTRKEKGNVIPGVAIATALMPPLCTVGYGLATGQQQFIFGALYLYAINSVFICLATLIGVKYLKLPVKEYVHPEKAARTKKILVMVVIVTLIPAIYLAYGLVKENSFNQNATRYIQDAFISKGYSMIYKNIDYRSNPSKIELAFLSKQFNPSEINSLEALLATYHLANTRLDIKQGNTSLTEEQWSAAIAKIQNESERIRAIETKLSGGFIGPDTTTQILKEAQAINSKVTRVAVGNLSLAENEQAVSSTTPSNSASILVALIYTAQDTHALSIEEKNTLTNWIQSRMQNRDIFVYFF